MQENHSPNPTELRLQAEARLQAREQAATQQSEMKDVGSTLHELRVHQIEIEMQNEELRRTQHELEATRARYFDLYDLAPVSYLTLSEQGVILEANLTAATLLGVPRGALVQQPFPRFILSEDADHYHACRKQLSETSLPQTCDLRILQGGLGTPQSSPPLLWVQLTATAAQDDDGAPLVRVVLTDITRRKLAEVEQERTARQWQTTFDANNDAIWILDNVHRVLRSNQTAEKFFQRPCRDMLGQPCHAIIHGATAPHPNCPFERARQSGRRETLELQQGGQQFEVMVDPIFDAAGQFAGAVHIVSDITERRKLENQLLRNQRMESIGTLAGGIAHDLNNILTPLMMSLDVLKDPAIDAQERDALVAMLKSGVLRASDLVRQVLAFGRGIEGQRIPVNPNHIAREIQKVIAQTFPKNLAAYFRLKSDLWTVTGDATQLHQVLMNLCVNARDAMPLGGQLNVSTENIVLDKTYATMNPEAKPGPYALLTVTDTGTGIPREIQDRIFEPFFTTKGVGKGTGLGLSTTFAIVKSHGGFIHLNSEPGQGATFKVYLPANTAPPIGENATAAPIQHLHGHGELVLVVDDEAAIRNIIQPVLQSFGYRVLLAVHGGEAVSLYAQHRDEVAVVLMDMAMPVMDGPTAIIALKAMDPQVCIISSSGHASEEDLTKVKAAGVRHFVPKPYTAESLLKALARALQPPA